MCLLSNRVVKLRQKSKTTGVHCKFAVEIDCYLYCLWNQKGEAWGMGLAVGGGQVVKSCRSGIGGGSSFLPRPHSQLTAHEMWLAAAPGEAVVMLPLVPQSRCGCRSPCDCSLPSFVSLGLAIKDKPLKSLYRRRIFCLGSPMVPPINSTIRKPKMIPFST